MLPALSSLESASVGPAGQHFDLDLMQIIFRQTAIRGVPVAPSRAFERMNNFRNKHEIPSYRSGVRVRASGVKLVNTLPTHNRMGVRKSERLDYGLGTAVVARIGAEQLCGPVPDRYKKSAFRQSVNKRHGR